MLQIRSDKFKEFGDQEHSWERTVVLEPTEHSNTEILQMLGMEYKYSYPGGPYSHEGTVIRSETGVRIVQDGGLDI